MATIPALVLSRDEVRVLLRMLGAETAAYSFSRDEYVALKLAANVYPDEARVYALIEAMQAVARQED